MTNLAVYDITEHLVQSISEYEDTSPAEIMEEAILEYMENHELQFMIQRNRKNSPNILPSDISIPFTEIEALYQKNKSYMISDAVKAWLQNKYCRAVQDFAGFFTGSTVEVGKIKQIES